MFEWEHFLFLLMVEDLSLPVWWVRMTLVMVPNLTRTHKLIMPHHISLSHADEGVWLPKTGGGEMTLWTRTTWCCDAAAERRFGISTGFLHKIRLKPQNCGCTMSVVSIKEPVGLLKRGRRWENHLPATRGRTVSLCIYCGYSYSSFS